MIAEGENDDRVWRGRNKETESPPSHKSLHSDTPQTDTLTLHLTTNERKRYATVQDANNTQQPNNMMLHTTPVTHDYHHQPALERRT